LCCRSIYNINTNRQVGLGDRGPIDRSNSSRLEFAIDTSKQTFVRCGVGLDPIPHRPVVALALVLCPQQSQLAVVADVDDPNATCSS